MQLSYGYLTTSHPADRAASEPFPDLVLGRQVLALRQVFRRLSTAVGVLFAFSMLYLMVVRPEYVVPFGLIGGSAWGAMRLGLTTNCGGLPIIALITLQHGISYGMPLVVQNGSLERYPSEILVPASVAFVVFIAALTLGWYVGKQRQRSSPSKFFLIGDSVSRSATGSLGRIGIGLMLLGLIFQVSLLSGLYWRLSGDIGQRLFSTCQAVSLTACTAGAFLGSFASTRTAGSIAVFWMCWLPSFFLLISGALLSGATGLVLATAAGLFLGRRRPPWLFAITVLIVLGFLNLGKFDIRERYWSTKGDVPSVGIIGLPKLYAEWFEASLSKLRNRTDAPGRTSDHGQSLADRVNNLQSLLFVTNALVVEETDTLAGQGYVLLPSVFVPRAFWPDKPRTHEGQVLLNIHFGRQGSVEETQRTYIAWGLLPEAIGNFGMWLGPSVLGLMMGFSSGWIETWSIRKNLFSFEGMGACMLSLSAAISFEMSMGVLLAMLFQSAIALFAGGILLRSVASR